MSMWKAATVGWAGRAGLAMSYPTLFFAAFGAASVLLLQLAPAEARPLYVATDGSDDNNCLVRDTACRFLQRAHDVAAPGDTIVVVDSGNFSSVTITKSIAIAATGVNANSVGGAITRITIDAGPDDVIDIDGLAIGRNTISGGSSGIDFVSGWRLNVRNCTMRNFGAAGIHIRAGGAKRVHVSDCTIANNWHGVWARGGGGDVQVFLDRVTLEGNLRDGVRSQGSGAKVRINNSTITSNRTGLRSMRGGQLISFGNNAIHGNIQTNGAPTATVTLK